MPRRSGAVLEAALAAAFLLLAAAGALALFGEPGDRPAAAVSR